MSFRGAAGRTARLLLVLLAVSAVSFGLLRALPGDPATVILGRGASEEDIAQVREELELDRPLVRQYWGWLGRTLSGDLGTSYRSQRPVSGLLGERLATSLELVVLSQVLALAAAVPIGLRAAHRRGSPADRLCDIGGVTLLALPTFVLGTLLVYLFAVTLRWLPASGLPAFGDDALGHAKAMVLPALTLAGWQFAMYSQLLRADSRTVLSEEYVETAVLKGLPTRRVLWRHVLKPASLGLVSLVPITLGELLGGAIVVETLFSLPGLGRLMVDAVSARDLTVLQAGVLAIATCFVLLNLLADVALRAIDPRIRRGVHG